MPLPQTIYVLKDKDNDGSDLFLADSNPVVLLDKDDRKTLGVYKLTRKITDHLVPSWRGRDAKS